MKEFKKFVLLGLLIPSAQLFAQDVEEPTSEPQEAVLFEESMDEVLPETNHPKTRTHDMAHDVQKENTDDLTRRSTATREAYMRLSTELFKRGQEEFIRSDFEKAAASFIESREEIKKCYQLNPTDAAKTLDPTNLHFQNDASDKKEYVKWPEFVKKRISECDQAIAMVYVKWAEKLIGEADGLFREDNPTLAQEAINRLEEAKKIWPEYTIRCNQKIEVYKRKLEGLLVNEATSVAGAYPTKAKDEWSINVWMRRGKNYYDVGRLEEATQCFDEVKRIDPYNMEAADYRRKINDAHLRIARERFEIVTRESYGLVNSKYGKILPRRDNITEAEAEISSSFKAEARRISPIESKLDNIFIENLSFEDVPLTAAIRNLRDRAKVNDLPSQEGVNIVLKVAAPSDEAEPVFDLAAADEFYRINTTIPDKVSLREALKVICESAERADVKLSFRVDQSAILIFSDNMSVDNLVSKSWIVESDFPENSRELKEYFTSMGYDFKSAQTAAVYDGATKVLHATNTTSIIRELGEFIDNLNTGTKQVSIDVRFVEVAQQDLNELGFDWMLTRIPPEGANIHSIPFRFGTSVSQSNEFNFPSTSGTTGDNAINPISPNNTTQPVANALRSIGQNGIGTRYGNSPGLTTVYDKAFWWRYTADRRTGSATDPSVPNNWGNNWTKGVDIDLAIRALSQAQSSDVLACPRITTRDNEEATISMVTDIYYPVDWSKPQVNAMNNNNNNGGDNANRIPVGIIGSTPEFREKTPIGINLTVTPNVRGENVYLDMKPQVLAFAGWLEYSYALDLNNDGLVDEETELQTIQMPSIERRDVATKVLVRSGATVVMGGALKDKTYTMRDKIPILGDIPLVGRFFRTEGENAAKTNLLIFVTPEIVKPNGRPENSVNPPYAGVPIFD